MQLEALNNPTESSFNYTDRIGLDRPTSKQVWQLLKQLCCKVTVFLSWLHIRQS